jgi:hypothetical protein
LGDGPPGFKQGFSCPALLRYPLRVRLTFAYVAITLFGWPFQAASTNQRIGNSTVTDPTTPGPAREARFYMLPVQRRVWAVPISLAATPGITIVFSSSRY